MFNFKKETRREKVVNAAKEAANTAGAIGMSALIITAAALANAAEVNAEYEASQQKNYSNNNYNRGNNYSNSHYSSVRNATNDITVNFMKEFVRSFGSLETRVERNMRSGYMHGASYNGCTFKNYYCAATFRVACSAYDWKLYAGVENGVVYMVLTNRYDSIIDVASCYANDLYNKFRAEAVRNYRVNDVHTAVLKAIGQ